MLDGSSLRVHLAVVVCLVASVWTAPAQAGKREKRVLDFAAEMARVGSWREANHRWTSVLANNEENSHLHNNLAVAAEALGDWDEAAFRYEKALELEPSSFHIQENHRRFSVYREKLRRAMDGEDAEERRPAIAFPGGDTNRKGKVFRVTVGLPMPPRLKVTGDESILVISFLDDDTHLLDINREMVRVLNKLWALPYGIMLIGHSVDKDKKTRTGTVTKTQPTLPPSISDLIMSKVDMILLAEAETTIDDEGAPITNRVVRTQASDLYEAGDRYGVLEDGMPLDYAEFAKAFDKRKEEGQ